MFAARLLLGLGLLASALSAWDTLAHVWDPAFRAPALPLGPTHSNYHAFREFTLTLGAITVLVYGLGQPAARRTRPLWVVMLVIALGYHGGWWLPGPLFGLYAPNRMAAVDHAVATVLTLAGVLFARRHYRADPP